MVRWPRGQGRKPPLGWSRGAPSGTDRSWCHRGDRVTGRKCPRQRGENGPQLAALLQAPQSASAGHAGAGRWPKPADPAVGNIEEQGRARHRPSCSQESQGSRGGGTDTGQTQEEEGCQWGSRQSPSGSQQQQKPQFGAGRDALGCKGQRSGPEVGRRQWSQNPWAVPAHIILPAPGFRLKEW